MNGFSFDIEKKLRGKLGRAGVIRTPHGVIETPAFVAAGTKASVKALTPEQVRATDSQVVLANTFHLYLEPGAEVVREAGGLSRFMGWNGPTMTDSGGFQVFSLGAAFGRRLSKLGGPKLRDVSSKSEFGNLVPKFGKSTEDDSPRQGRLVRIDEGGVTFTSPKDGSEHRFTPEKAIEIQRAIGADVIFAFDECTSPVAPFEYQREAMNRTHRWAARCLTAHLGIQFPSEFPSGASSGSGNYTQALFGIVQGGRHEDLRRESALVIGGMDFDGFGIGGSFDKRDLDTAVRWVNELLPEEKPRHLLGIGEPTDLIRAIEEGCDLFDCVAPTRNARNGSLYTPSGPVNISNSKYRSMYVPLDENCSCYVCQNYTVAYLSHLYRASEMLAATLGSIHNLHFVTSLVSSARTSILDGTFSKFKEAFMSRYPQAA